jgi:predicted nucleotidyltransferase
MIELIEKNQSRLDELCRRFYVKTLEVFGSAADGTFDLVHSDLDFLVDFLPMEPGPHSKAYFGLWFALQDLFGRPVDLIESPAIRNPYFTKTINQTRRVLYAA